MTVSNILGRDFYQGLDADMATCVPRVNGALFWTTDTLTLYCWSGAAWNEVGTGGGGNVATDAIWDAKGDLAAGTGPNTAAKVTVGTDGKYLKADSGQATGVSWDTPAGNMATDALWDAKGDLAVGTGANTAAKLTVGADGKVLTAASGEATGLKWDSVPSPTFVGARYCSNAEQTLVDGAAFAIIDFEDQTYDTGGLVTTGAAWKFTAPSTGYYHVDCFVVLAQYNGWATAERCWIQLFKGGVLLLSLDRQDGKSGTIQMCVHGNATVYLTASEYIDVRITQNAGADIKLDVDPTRVWINIDKVG